MPEIPFKATILGFYFVIPEVVISTKSNTKEGAKTDLANPIDQRQA